MSDFYGEIHEEIMREYANIREKNKEIYEKTTNMMYAHFPRIKEIDDELESVALKACSGILKSGNSPKQVIQSMKLKTDMLVEEKRKIIASSGMTENCMDEIFNCKICKDKGYIDGKRCKCYFEKMKKYIQKRSNISAEKMHSFAKFDTGLYSDNIDEEYGISPRENAECILKTAVKFAKEENGCPRHLLFYGGTGLGKTFTSECIAREYIKRGKSVFYTSAPKLLSIFEDYKFGRNTSEEIKGKIDYISCVDLLIIDDLGTEFRTQYTDSILFDIINTRIIDGASMIISTNLSSEELNSTYSARISSRIIGNFELMEFFGDDLRLKKR
ncbi:MAG: ATP-binding protein [Clostridia bacterium]|nr:ATP-binding protein [Clostridia bacterium]